MCGYSPDDTNRQQWLQVVMPHLLALEPLVAGQELRLVRSLLQLGSVHVQADLAAGRDMTPAALWSRDRVERTIAVELVTQHGAQSATAATYASRLRRISRALAPASHGVQKAKAARQPAQLPYTTQEVRSYLDWARAQPDTDLGRELLGLLWLALGTGATDAELRGVRGTDIMLTEHAVVVMFPTRTVPVHHSCEYHVLHLASWGDGPLFRTVTKDLAGYLIRAAKGKHRGGHRFIPPTMTRLRTTWLALVLGDGADLLAVQRASGLALGPRFEVLGEVLTPLPEQQYQQALRGTRNADTPSPPRQRIVPAAANGSPTPVVPLLNDDGSSA